MKAILLLLIAWGALCGCEVFIPDIGEEGQPCSKNGFCISEELRCVNQVCSMPLELGETCDMELDYVYSFVSYSELKKEQCAAPWICIDGTCAAVGHEGEMCVPSQHCREYHPTDYCAGAVYNGEGFCRDYRLVCTNNVCQAPE